MAIKRKKSRGGDYANQISRENFIKKLSKVKNLTIKDYKEMSKKITMEEDDLNSIEETLHSMSGAFPDIPEIDDDYKANSETFDISFIELAMLNKYLHSAYVSNAKDITVSQYGYSDNLGRVSFGGAFDATESFWYLTKFNDEYKNEYIFNTKINQDNRGNIVTQLHVSSKEGTSIEKLMKVFEKLRMLAFNNSEYVGKCIKVKLMDGHFWGIDVIEFEPKKTELILNETQNKYIQHFINRIKRGSTARYLLNGEPGTGKTECIRDLIRQLSGTATFIIPQFKDAEDLTIILEACEIFHTGVIIMDDIDLYLGSRENGNYTRLLGDFLSFFDGVKKRKISLLASTNDKGLVDKAAERPGRFNMTIDYTFLDSEQIDKVCKIHLPKKYHVKEVFDALKGDINGKKAKITGAFIANLSDNIKEMSEDDVNWTVKDTISLITESYKGFYSTQVQPEQRKIGFNNNF